MELPEDITAIPFYPEKGPDELGAPEILNPETDSMVPSVSVQDLAPDVPLYEGGPNITEAYTANEPFTRNLLRMKLGNVGLYDTGLAEDLTQVAFVRLWQRRGKLDENSTIRGYLSKVVDNLVIDEGRRKMRNKNDRPSGHEDLTESDSWRLESELSAEDEATYGMLSPELESALRKVTPEFRAVLLAIEVEGLTYRECAQRYGIKRGTVASRLNRAHSQLRQSYLDVANVA